MNIPCIKCKGATPLQSCGRTFCPIMAKAESLFKVKEILPEELEKYAYFWEEARIILVTPKEPHFWISYIKRFCKDGKLYNLENFKLPVYK